MAPPRKPNQDEIVDVFAAWPGSKRQGLLDILLAADRIIRITEERCSHPDPSTEEAPPFEATEPDQQP